MVASRHACSSTARAHRHRRQAHAFCACSLPFPREVTRGSRSRAAHGHGSRRCAAGRAHGSGRSLVVAAGGGIEALHEMTDASLVTWVDLDGNVRRTPSRTRPCATLLADPTRCRLPAWERLAPRRVNWTFWSSAGRPRPHTSWSIARRPTTCSWWPMVRSHAWPPRAHLGRGCSWRC